MRILLAIVLLLLPACRDSEAGREQERIDAEKRFAYRVKICKDNDTVPVIAFWAGHPFVEKCVPKGYREKTDE